MSAQHPITPPTELVKQWVTEVWHEGTPARLSLSDMHIATAAAQWGADHELEAWFAAVEVAGYPVLAASIRNTRRPKPTDEESVPLSPRVVTDSQIRSSLALCARLANSVDLLTSAAAEHEVFSARLDDLAALAVWACDDRDYRDAVEREAGK